MIDTLIVGAGLYGATCAKLLTDAGQRVLVLERRDEVGGNCHDAVQYGVRVSSYGGHIFHTNSERIWTFVNKYADWLPYVHRVKAYHKGRLYSFPPNTATFQQLGISSDDPNVDEILKEAFFKGYTEKQWGTSIDKVPADVLKRIPIRRNDDDRYFTDTYQGLPAQGYTAMIDKMLNGIEVKTGIDYLENETYWNNRCRDVIYTGALDEYYKYDIGALEFRGLRFEHTPIYARHFQTAATINYCDADMPYTRIMDWSWFWPKDVTNTVITVEYPEINGETYYPINNSVNNSLYSKYAKRAEKAKWLHVGGRLGAYKYWNMDQAIGAAMEMTNKLLWKEKL